MFKLTWCEAFPADLLNLLKILEFIDIMIVKYGRFF